MIWSQLFATRRNKVLEYMVAKKSYKREDADRGWRVHPLFILYGFFSSKEERSEGSISIELLMTALLGFYAFSWLASFSWMVERSTGS